MSDPFEKMVADARTVFEASASKPLRDAWAGLSLPQIRADLIERLSAAGIEEAGSDTRFLLAHVLAPASYADAVADPALCSWQQMSWLADLAWQRLDRRPLSQVLGSQPFWTLDLQVTEDVLTPRADSETLVELVLEKCGPAVANLADLGTGSGALLLALLSERTQWTGTGVDISAAALDVAGQNARRCGLDDRAHFVEGSWGAALAPESVDILVSNPPYIRTDVWRELAPEVRRFEPRRALDGGPDGLRDYRALLADAVRIVRPGGLVAVEIGYDQGEVVADLFDQAGLVETGVKRDLAGHDRVVFGAVVSTNG
ncbi:peptide chain release factor N(5)-glutamine methyltransferase [Maricaulis sp.]|uniref:peptide chain release factor N(5)-glutamine methyltransferase n=1 Tax=Maricaulis sp. TaxID=1486257 RepID=UPI00261BE075|nr:peptide chain release factor N(5)-glutamine methyltransferase [Maricaulis sp.]